MEATAHQVPLYAVSGFTTPHNSIMQDIEQAARTGGRGIGLLEEKLADGQDLQVREALKAHGLTPTLCAPKLWTILHTPLGPEEPDWKVRVQRISQSISRLAVFDPVCIMVGPGVSGDPAVKAGPIEAVAEGLAIVADRAKEHGLRIGFELLSARRGAALSDLVETVELIDSVGRDNIDILFDVWHSWDEPNLHERIRNYADRFRGVQVNDYREPTRGWCDRVLPGEGRGVAPEIMAMLLEAGYDGWWELEIFSDDGTRGTAYPDSLWHMPHEELLARGKAAFDRCFEEAQNIVARWAGER